MNDDKKCRTGRTILTIDWCYTHNRYIINCVDLGIITEEEVWTSLTRKSHDDLETDQGHD